MWPSASCSNRAIFRKHGYAIGTLVTEGNKMIKNGEIFASPKMNG
jgi:hypothetical protein